MKKSPLRLRPWERMGLSKDLQYLTENIGLLLASGVDVVSAIASIEAGVRSSVMKRVLRAIGERMAAGDSLSSVLAETQLFPARTISLIKVGEEKGQLVTHFKMISAQEEKQRSLRSKIRSAIFYPSFVFIMTIIVGVGVSWFILPRLAKVFFQLKIKLPLITKIVLGFGAFLGAWGIYAVPAAVVCISTLVYFLFYHPASKRAGEFILTSLPGVRGLIQQVEMTRLGFILGGLLKGGIPFLEALTSLQGATESFYYKKFYEHVRVQISSGESLEQAFHSYSGIDALVPLTAQQLIITGSKSGTLNDVLLRLGADYEEKSDTSMRNLAVILEPALLFLVWIAVVSVALGVILPIYDLVGSINHH